MVLVVSSNAHEFPRCATLGQNTYPALPLSSLFGSPATASPSHWSATVLRACRQTHSTRHPLAAAEVSAELKTGMPTKDAFAPTPEPAFLSGPRPFVEVPSGSCFCFIFLERKRNESKTVQSVGGSGCRVGEHGRQLRIFQLRQAFKNTYPASPLSTCPRPKGVAGNLCTVCHGPSGPPLNLYRRGVPRQRDGLCRPGKPGFRRRYLLQHHGDNRRDLPRRRRTANRPVRHHRPDRHGLQHSGDGHEPDGCDHYLHGHR